MLRRFVQTCLVAAAVFHRSIVLEGQTPPTKSPSGGTLDHTTEQFAPPAPVQQEHRICRGDLLDVEVFDEPEFSHVYRVTPDGSIRLPLLKEPIAAVGLTPSQLSEVMAEKLRDGGLLKDPQVLIQVKESPTHSVTVTGAVRKPLIFPVFDQTTLLDVLSTAEGLSDDAGDVATIVRGRNQAGQGSTLTVDLKGLLESGNPASNVVLYPGDRVTVPHAGLFYVLGAVNKPGGYTLKEAQEEVTILMALATAGGTARMAKPKHAVIIRRNPQAPEGREEIAINLSEIVQGRAPDKRLRANDILYVPESGQKRAMATAVSTMVGASTNVATGLIIYRR